MKETLHFRYESVENIVRLMVTIQYEKTHNPRDIDIYHQRFDKESDNIFYEFMVKLFPDGVTIGEKEINDLIKHIEFFLEIDEEAKDIAFQYDLIHRSSYVAFIIDKKIYDCSYASHQQTLKKICVDYFKGFSHDELSVESVKKFILDNFIVRSSFSSVETLARDARYIYDCIIFENEMKGKANV